MRFGAGEAVEAIFADEDSEDENFDCRSDIEYVPNSEMNLQVKRVI